MKCGEVPLILKSFSPTWKLTLTDLRKKQRDNKSKLLDEDGYYLR